MDKVSLGELKIQIRLVTDTDKSKHISETFLNGTVNRWSKRLYKRLAIITPRHYATLGFEFPTVSGVQDYDLPRDFWRLLQLQITDGAATVPVQAWQYGDEQARLRTETQVTTPTFTTLRHQVTSRGLSILPTPNTNSWTFILDYLPRYKLMTLDTHEVDAHGFEDWIIYNCAVDVAKREDGDWTGFDEKAKEVEEDIRVLGDPDPANPPTVVDVDPRFRRRRYFWMPSS